MSPENRALVLVVDDEPVVNQLVCASLSGEYEVASAFDGKEGLEKALELKPDCIISDLLMPEMTGEELLAELRTRDEFASVPIILLTGRGDDQIRAQLLRTGAQDFLAKPFSPLELRARVTNWVSAKRAREVLQSALDSQGQDLEALAREVIVSQQDLQQALKTVRKARDEAEQASRLKSDFLALVSHEFRTPLTALQLQLKVLLSLDEELGPRQQAVLTRMSGSLTRLRTLIESVLQYACIESGSLSVDFQVIDVGALCVEVLDELEPHAAQKGIDLRSEIPRERPELATDPQLLRLVLVNLVSNALKFTDDGYVELRLEIGESHYRLTISDTGPGIAAEDIGRIFQPFEQLAGTKRKHLPGVGLGLALVQDMVVLLGGRVELDSVPDSGSAFTVVLPNRASTTRE